MDDAFGAALDFTMHFHQPRGHHFAPIPLEGIGPHDDVGHAGFILDRHEDRLAVTRPLTHQHDARHAHALARPRLGNPRR
jgi:hypothetical protein